MKYMSAKYYRLVIKHNLLLIPTLTYIEKKVLELGKIFNEMGFKIIGIKPFIKHH